MENYNCDFCKYSKKKAKKNYWKLIPYLIAGGITLYAAIEQFYFGQDKKEGVKIEKTVKSIDNFFE
ncbi:hypothetical protein GW932_01810 [archaeon]|nr:hypothetical protein [archaeon]